MKQQIRRSKLGASGLKRGVAAAIVTSFVLAGCAPHLAAQEPPQATAEETKWSPFFQRNTLLVSDLDRSIALYRDVLNFTPNSVLTVEDYPALTSVYSFFDIDEEAEIRFTSFNAGDAQVRALALIEVEGLAAAQPASPRRSGAVIRVGDHKAVLEKAKALGLETLEPNFVDDPSFAYVEAGFVDYDGHLIIIIEFLPKG